MTARPKRGGAPQKVPGGLTKVLFVRVNKDLLREIEVLRRSYSAGRSGAALSMADVTRMILWDAIERRKALTNG